MNRTLAKKTLLKARVDEPLARAVLEFARAEDRPVSSIIRRALREHLKREELRRRRTGVAA